MQNARNYKVDNLTGYNVIEITRISDLNQSTQTYRALNRLKNKYTHIIKVKGIQNLYGNLIISLENNLPTWIQDTGIENDCEIIGNTEQTFAFDQLINGISNAYQRVNKDDKYLKINLNIEP